jgi:hypothetical protein
VVFTGILFYIATGPSIWVWRMWRNRVQRLSKAEA